MKEFEEAKIEVVHFDLEDLVVTSGCKCLEGGGNESTGEMPKTG